ncbi:hypothetical protein Y032_0228g2884 [Ancylostoma ceylanicum]|uniref:Uncharacterized protein n=1 Tax=Ancylostoma ceylanicum TaxID=53326 RepID=A0A016SH88_9BILA|nr:hypothetical protein Y032_0228g2884 [Ancylostoma ceylanicum]
MYRTAAKLTSSTQERIWSGKMAHEIAKSNGYPMRECSPRLAHRRSRLADGSEKIPFCLPSISDEVNTEEPTSGGPAR